MSKQIRLAAAVINYSDASTHHAVERAGVLPHGRIDRLPVIRCVPLGAGIFAYGPYVSFSVFFNLGLSHSKLL